MAPALLLLQVVTGRVGDPHWANWWIVFDFFTGGIAAGAFLAAAMAALFAGREYRPVIRAGYLLALPLLALNGLLLTLDLNRPERFWHMLWNITTNTPSFKYWSPMSYGSLLLTGFSLFSFLAVLLVLLEWRGWRNDLLQGPLGKVVAAIGLFFAIMYGTYTGALLNATNQRVWGDNTLFGALFVASAVLTGIAAIVLIFALRGDRGGPALVGLVRAAIIAVAVKLAIIAMLVVALVNANAARGLITGAPGIALWVGVVLLGLLVPLVLYLRPRLLGAMTPLVGAVLALLGGFAMRWAVLWSSLA